jgi:GDPmannose 4,6-dehydratase
MSTALITGITGQDGAYLAQLLLEKGYRVVGAFRRASTVATSRLDALGITDDIEMVPFDLTDHGNMRRVIDSVEPEEIYNLAAQSFVGVSFEQPVTTGEITGVGVVRLLEAIREANPAARFYQASTSEMFGKAPAPQSEDTPFYPRSPYAVSKLYAHWSTVNYRESYGMHASSGILFNHECLSETTPLMIRRDGFINVVTPGETVPLKRKGPSQQTFRVPGLEVWDGKQWANVSAITATRRRQRDPDHRMLLVQARGGVVEATSHHHMLDSGDNVLAARDVAADDHLALADGFPEPPAWTTMTCELAEFLGLMTAEGYVPSGSRAQFTNTDPKLRDHVAALWSKLFMGTTATRFAPSGWEGGEEVGQLYLRGAISARKWLREQLYDSRGRKRVPPLVLNGEASVQAAYLEGYYEGDGLQAGNGDSIKTNSALLAQGLCWLYANQGRLCSVYAEQRDDRTYYQLNISSGRSQGNKGQHLRKPASQVRRVTEAGSGGEWVFDLETGSGRLCAGVGRLVVHNSPIRGAEFVTRKITLAAARIKHGIQKDLKLGNLDARRDWGYAKEYVEAMHMMLQQPDPDDYVIATGETHSVREFVEAAFDAAGLDWERHVVTDPAFLRPAEVDLLLGDITKAKEKLGWAPKTAFKDLIALMVEADLKRAAFEARHGRESAEIR